MFGISVYTQIYTILKFSTATAELKYKYEKTSILQIGSLQGGTLFPFKMLYL